MEFLELLLASADACGCFMQVLAAVLDVSAGVRGYQVGKRFKQRRDALKHGDDAPPKPLIWPLVILVFVAVLCTGLALFALFRPAR